MKNLEIALERIATIILNGKEKINTFYGLKRKEGIKDLIFCEIKEAMGNMRLEDICEYFEI